MNLKFYVVGDNTKRRCASFCRIPTRAERKRAKGFGFELQEFYTAHSFVIEEIEVDCKAGKSKLGFEIIGVAQTFNQVTYWNQVGKPEPDGHRIRIVVSEDANNRKNPL